MEGTRARRAVPSRATERRAWGGAVDPCGRSTYRRSCSLAGDEVAAQRGTLEVDAVRTVNDAIEDGVTESRIADYLMPAIDWDLAGDQQRAAIVAVVDDLEQIAALLGIERLRSPIVDDQQADAFERCQHPRQPAFAARLGEIGEQARSALVKDREAVAAGLVAESASQPRLADTSWADDHQMVMLAQPVAGGELLEQGAVETAMRAVVDVLDDGGLAQPGFPETTREALVLAAGCLTVDQQPKPVLAAEFAGVGRV